jgi:hypothetical protein
MTDEYSILNKREIERYSKELKQLLVADFLGLEQTDQDEILSHYDQSKHEQFPESLSLSELWTLEQLIIKKLPDKTLIRSTWIFREKFKIQLGDGIYKKYYENLPKSLTDESLKDASAVPDYDMLREDMANIARQMQRLAYFKIRRNQSINGRKKFVIISMIILVIIGILPFSNLNLNFPSVYNSENETAIKFLLIIMYSGITGTAISLLQRIEKASNVAPHFTDSALDANDIALNMSNWYVMSLLASGAIFALLVYFISIAGIFNVVDFLPKLEPGSNTKYTDVNKIFKQLVIMPDSPKDFAKLLIACFLSGFAERLIPDMLDSLIKKGESKSPK